MKTKDESLWQLQLSELASDPDPMAKKFQEFIIAWCEAAESILDMWVEKNKMNYEPEFDDPDRQKWWPIKALRDALPITEQQTKGGLTVGLLGMALLVVATHWEPVGDIDKFYDSMTTIEQNLYMSVGAVKLMELDRQAQRDASDDLYGHSPDLWVRQNGGPDVQSE